MEEEIQLKRKKKEQPLIHHTIVVYSTILYLPAKRPTYNLLYAGEPGIRTSPSGKALKYDADHAVVKIHNAVAYRSMQFSGSRLVSWSLKRQKSAAISRTGSGIYCYSGFCRYSPLCCNNDNIPKTKLITSDFTLSRSMLRMSGLRNFTLSIRVSLANIFTKPLQEKELEYSYQQLGMHFAPRPLKQLADEVDE
ncbi:hypothetical protein Tco_0476341 [Tanacetum coccineum]